MSKQSSKIKLPVADLLKVFTRWENLYGALRLLPVLPPILRRGNIWKLTEAIGPLMRGEFGRALLPLFDLGDKLCTGDDKGRRFTYSEYKDRALRLTNALIDLGLKKRDNMAIIGRNSPEFHEIAYIPPFLLDSKMGEINFHITHREVQQLIDSLQAKVLFIDEEFLDKIERTELKSVKEIIVIGENAPSGMLLYEGMIESSSSNIPDSDLAPGTLSGGPMPYTAGTTGLPKGTDISSRLGEAITPEFLNYKAFGALESQWLDTNFIFNSQVNLHLAPLYHGAAFYLTLVAFIVGGANITMKKFDAEGALRLIEEVKATGTFMPPILLRRILNVPDKKRYDVSSLKTIWVSGAPCPVDTEKEAIDFFGPVIYEDYASTDAGNITWLIPEHYVNNLDTLKSVGKIAPGYKLKFLDENGKECPPGVDGVMYVSCLAGDFGKYYKDPEKTKARVKMIDGERYVNEGTMGHIDKDGFLYVLGRADEMIISGAVNIYPNEVEEVIYQHPKVADVCVIGVPDPEWGESIKAIVELKKGEKMTEGEIIEHCKKQLAGYKTPKSVEFWEELPRHIDGHIHKRKIKERYR